MYQGFFIGSSNMSWFNTRPKTKEHIVNKSHKSSPAANKMFEKTKESSPTKPTNTTKKSKKQ
jgi:hypothetical protein